MPTYSFAIFFGINRMPDKHLFRPLAVTIDTTVALLHDGGVVGYF